MNEINGFTAEDYFASYSPLPYRRRTKRFQMTPRQRAIFEEAMRLFRRGVPVETLQRLIREEVAR